MEKIVYFVHTYSCSIIQLFFLCWNRFLFWLWIFLFTWFSFDLCVLFHFSFFLFSLGNHPTWNTQNKWNNFNYWNACCYLLRRLLPSNLSAYMFICLFCAFNQWLQWVWREKFLFFFSPLTFGRISRPNISYHSTYFNTILDILFHSSVEFNTIVCNEKIIPFSYLQ